jgi:predicted dehydrogenase
MQTILLIGTGPMAIEYSKVLLAMNKKFIVVGRGSKSAELFKKQTGIIPELGGLDLYLKEKKLNKNTLAIIATGTETLMSIIHQLLKSGVEKILVEKPAAISIDELLDNETVLKPYNDSIFIAYNRRFYASVIEAERLIMEDGGLQSMHFEFTEWAHTIEPLKKAKGVKKNWFFANSTHVVDLAFFIAGNPKILKSFSKSGKLDWHNKTNFVGAGETEKGVLFSYISNWESAGRWGIELLTQNRRIYLKPMEDIHVQMKGSVNVMKHEVDLSLDDKFKAGLYLQVEEFISGFTNRLPTIKDHIEISKTTYSNILNISPD